MKPVKKNLNDFRKKYVQKNVDSLISLKMVFTMVVTVTMLASCRENGRKVTQYQPPTRSNPSSERYHAADVMQLIHPEDDDDSLDNNTDQEEYVVNARRRLLIRFNTFDPSRFWDTKKIRLTIIGKGNLRHLKLCILKKDWILGATWNYPVPGFNDESWDGGDIKMLDCINPTRTIEIMSNYLKNEYLVRDSLKNELNMGRSFYGWIAVGEFDREDLVIKGERGDDAPWGDAKRPTVEVF